MSAIKFYPLNFFIVFLFLCNLLSTGCKKDEGVKVTSLNSVGLNLVYPFNLSNFAEGDTIQFHAVLHGDSIKDFSNLKVIWRSNIDGVIKEINGIKDLSLVDTKLSTDEHIISIEIRNEVDSIKKAFVKIRKGVRQFNPEKTDNSVILRWKKYRKDNFKAYKIVRYYHSEIDTIASLTPATDTTFRDTSIQLGTNYRYVVLVNLQSGSNLRSNEQSVTAGNFLLTNYPISKLLKDPTRDRVYGIVSAGFRYGNSLNGNGIVVINTKDFKIEKRILQDIAFTDLTISLDGKHLYLASGSTSIQKIDLDTYEIKTPIYTYSKAYHIRVGNNDRLFYHITPPTSGSTEFRIVDLASNREVPYKDKLTDAQRAFYMGDFDLDPVTNTIYHVETLTSGTLSKLTSAGDILGLEDSRFTSSWSGIPFFNASKRRLFLKERVYDTSLNIIGEFYKGTSEAFITAVAPSGNLALSYNDLFNSNTFKKIRTINAVFQTSTFLDDHGMILCNTQNPLSGEYTCQIFRYTFN